LWTTLLLWRACRCSGSSEMGRSFLASSEIRGLWGSQSISGKPATLDSSVVLRHDGHVRQAVSTELLCRINIQLRWGRNLGVGRSRSAKNDICGLNVSSDHRPPCTLQLQEQMSGMFCLNGWRTYDAVWGLFAGEWVEPCRMGIHVILTSRHKLYVSAALFQQCTTIVLIQFIDSPRMNDEFVLKPVNLLMDACEIDRRWNGFPTWKENDIRVIVFMPNTIQISNPLGLSLLDVLKKKMQEKLPAIVSISPPHSFKGLPVHWGNYLLR
jgi:hypothetical protein